MAWGRIDDGFYDNAKVLALENRRDALNVWVRLLSWCYRHQTQGVVPSVVAVRFGTAQALQKLVRVGLFEEHGPEGRDFRFHDFADYAPRPEIVEAKRRAGKLGALARWGRPPSASAPPEDGICHPLPPAAAIAANGRPDMAEALANDSKAVAEPLAEAMRFAFLPLARARDPDPDPDPEAEEEAAAAAASCIATSSPRAGEATMSAAGARSPEVHTAPAESRLTALPAPGAPSACRPPDGRASGAPAGPGGAIRGAAPVASAAPPTPPNGSSPLRRALHAQLWASPDLREDQPPPDWERATRLLEAFVIGSGCSEARLIECVGEGLRALAALRAGVPLAGPGPPKGGLGVVLTRVRALVPPGALERERARFAPRSGGGANGEASAGAGAVGTDVGHEVEEMRRVIDAAEARRRREAG